MPLNPTTAMRKDRKSANNAITTMQHRHFAFIAKVIAASGERSEDKRRWANYFAHALDGTNPNFDRARFFSAVGVDDPYVTQAAYGGDPVVQTIVKKLYGDDPKLARDEITGKTFEETFGKLPDDWV